VIILLLVLLWGVVLGPSLFRWWRDGRISESVVGFHRRLSSLRNVEPPALVDPANPLQAAPQASVYGSSLAVRPLPPPASSVKVVPLARRRPHMVGPAGEAIEVVHSVGAGIEEGATVQWSHLRDGQRAYAPDFPAPVSPYRVQVPVGAMGGHSPSREATLRRRRNVVSLLGACALCFLVLGAVPAMRAAWLLSLVTVVVLVAYLALVFRLEANAASRRTKVVALPAGLQGRRLGQDLSGFFSPSFERAVGYEGPLEEIAETVVVRAASGA